MSIPLPTILYKVPGPHFSDVRVNGKLVTYNYAGAKTEEQLEKLLDEGWKETIKEAAGLTSSTPTPTKLDPLFKASSYAAISRADLESQADELGLQYDGRTSDRKLMQLIADSKGG